MAVGFAVARNGRQSGSGFAGLRFRTAVQEQRRGGTRMAAKQTRKFKAGISGRAKNRGLKSSPKLGAGKPKATEGRTGSVDLPEDENQNDTKVAGESDTKSEQRARPGFWVRKRVGAREPSGLENAESGKLAASDDGTGSRRDLEKGGVMVL